MKATNNEELLLLLHTELRSTIDEVIKANIAVGAAKRTARIAADRCCLVGKIALKLLPDTDYSDTEILEMLTEAQKAGVIKQEPRASAG